MAFRPRPVACAVYGKEGACAKSSESEQIRLSVAAKPVNSGKYFSILPMIARRVLLFSILFSILAVSTRTLLRMVYSSARTIAT